ncbi:bifunctional NAD(P)/FAD-dependent oxidoreductase/class I SAM-dependent methyltransferase [Streptomyces sp. NPDC048057]|uniref:bifunctional NAD(P)/FAD-dependent oxidoreductase/class I SAM-dependent methyltransferase n=1 Tax=Streptomyces sp. NPDC048057 TaxID=3155628 RepID=UPI0033E6AB3C
MSHHHTGPASSGAPAASTVIRHCDVAVIGGSAAGLATALQLGRQRRSVIVVDSGEPRNAPAAHMHGFLGRDGTDPAELLAAGRAEVRSYGGEVLSGRAVRVARDGELFVVELAEGTSIVARRIVVATGLVDDLPEVEGLADHWGSTVIHCPFCHGYEARDQQMVQLITHPMGLHVTPLLRQLSTRLTVLVADGVEVDESEVATLISAGVDVRLATTAHRVLTDADGRLTGIELIDGSMIGADAILINPRFAPRAEPFTGLGLQPSPHPTGTGQVIEVDAMGATASDGVYAVGSITDPSQQVLSAAAHGSRVGGAVAMGLAAEDVRTAARPSGSVADWDHRYSGDPIWSGNPNGSLVAEVADLPVGRALDVGAGEGGDAIWLAEQGWEVTASDISSRALDRIRVEAERRDLTVTCELADANAWEPFAQEAAQGGFDLVSAAYASIPRTPDLRGAHNVLDAVAPGGSLVILSHDLEAMRNPQHEHRPFDPDAYLHIDDFVTAIKATAGWTIQVDDKCPRPPGSASASHHTHDRVLRARRAS